MDALTRIERALEASIQRLEVKASPPRLSASHPVFDLPGRRARAAQIVPRSRKGLRR